MLLIDHYIASSPVHGLGVFARDFVPSGTLVWKVHPAIDREIHEFELRDLPQHVVKLIETHSEYLAELKRYRLSADGGYFMNHADDPNLLDLGDVMYARRDIHPGEELFCDYRIARVKAFDPDAVPVPADRASHG